MILNQLTKKRSFHLNLLCLILGHKNESFSKNETYTGYSGVLQKNKAVIYKRCTRCHRTWKEIWCGFSEIYWEEV